MDLGLTLMAYCSAFQSSTDVTPYFLLYGKEMSVPLDIIYRHPSLNLSRTYYAQEVCRVLKRAFVTANRKRQLSHERQKDHYDRQSRRKRLKPGDSVRLWSPAVKNGIAPKFHEPWTGQYKVIRRLFDVTYEILDVARKTMKVVHFDCLKKVIVKPRALILSESEPKKTSSSKTISYDSETPGLSATNPKTVKPKSNERALQVAKDIEAAEVTPHNYEHTTEATAEPAPSVETTLVVTTSSNLNN